MRTILSLLALATAGSSLGGQGRPAMGQGARLSLSDSLATWYALGLNAHHLCAGLWVVGRDYTRTPDAVVAEDISRFPGFRWESDFTFRVDSISRTATISDPQVGSRSARYSGDQGCAILPSGATNVFFEPATVRPSLPDASTQDWPTGDRNAAAALPDAARASIDATLTWAFDDPKLPRAQYTRAVIAIHRGRIVAERYAAGWGPYTPQLSWSMGKSIAATLTGVLAQQGVIALDQSAPVTEWQKPGDPRRAIRIRDLLNMSSGLDFDNFGLDPTSSYTAANEHFRIYFDALDVFSHSIHQPLRFTPGTVQRYRNSDPLTLMAIARRSVESTGVDWLSFPQRHLFDRIGARSFVLETDAWGNFIITGFDFGGARDWARLGLLYLWKGVWQGQRILPAEWAAFVSTPAPGDPSRGYGGLFWLNRGGSRPTLPADAYWMAGHMGQTVMIIPSRDLVLVRLGPSPGGDGPYFEELASRILAALPQTSDASRPR
ncbi:MAG: serine hydrolase domain-containing protein [Gemmatimonadaceae bacterium]